MFLNTCLIFERHLHLFQFAFRFRCRISRIRYLPAIITSETRDTSKYYWHARTHTRSHTRVHAHAREHTRAHIQANIGLSCRILIYEYTTVLCRTFCPSNRSLRPNTFLSLHLLPFGQIAEQTTLTINLSTRTKKLSLNFKYQTFLIIACMWD